MTSQATTTEAPDPALGTEKTYTESEFNIAIEQAVKTAVDQAVEQERKAQKIRIRKFAAASLVVVGSIAGAFYYAAKKHQELYGLSWSTYFNRATACMLYEKRIEGCKLMSAPDFRLMKEQAKEGVDALRESAGNYVKDLREKWFGRKEEPSCTCPKP